MCLALCFLKNGEFQPECVYEHGVYEKNVYYKKKIKI